MRFWGSPDPSHDPEFLAVVLVLSFVAVVVLGMMFR